MKQIHKIDLKMSIDDSLDLIFREKLLLTTSESDLY